MRNMGCSTSNLRSQKIQHHLTVTDPNRKIEEKIISLARSIKTLIEISLESRAEMKTGKVDSHVEERIIKNLEEIIKFTEMSSSLDNRVLNEYLTSYNSLRLHIPIFAARFDRLSKKAQMMIEDKTEDFSSPIILRIAEINKILLETYKSPKDSERVNNATIVIQRLIPSKPQAQEDLKLQKLFHINERLDDGEKSRTSECSMDYGFFDVAQEFERSFRHLHCQAPSRAVCA